MIDRADVTRSPAMRSPRERLAPTIARGRARDAFLPPIEAVRVTRLDVGYLGAKGDCARRVEISLPRVKFLERPER